MVTKEESQIEAQNKKGGMERTKEAQLWLQFNSKKYSRKNILEWHFCPPGDSETFLNNVKEFQKCYWSCPVLR